LFRGNPWSRAREHATIANVVKPLQLPTADEVWATVREFAERCRDDNRNLYTLAKFVANTIVHVDAAEIRRHSAKGRSQTAHITRRHVEGVWDELTKQHWASTKGHDRKFTHALLLHALPKLIEQASPNTIRLRVGQSIASTPRPTFGYDAGHDPRPGRRGGGEGPLHRALRLYIFENPDNALAGLAGGPWNICATERVLETQDRIDVVLRDNDGKFTLVEVKPKLVSDQSYPQLDSVLLPYAIAPFAQAAKYRTQWHMLYGTPIDRIRCVVAAPEVPRESLSTDMFHRYSVESVAVSLPADRVSQFSKHD
jgi:hypothetical protein